MKLSKANKILAALGQETRIEIFRLLIQEGPKGLPAGTISELLKVPNATLSFHLTQLSNAGLIKQVKEGRSVIYSAKNKPIKRLYEFLTENSYKKRMKERKVTIEIEGEEEEY